MIFQKSLGKRTPLPRGNLLHYQLVLFILFHLSSTLQYDLMLENELFAFTLFLMGINDSVLDQIGFRTLCRDELWSKTEVELYIMIEVENKFSLPSLGTSVNCGSYVHWDLCVILCTTKQPPVSSRYAHKEMLN